MNDHLIAVESESKPESISLDQYGRFEMSEMSEIIDPALLDEVSGSARWQKMYNVYGCSGWSKEYF